MSIRIVIAAILAAGAAASNPAAAAGKASLLSTVKSLYARKATPTRVRGLFAADLAEAYEKDIGNPGEVGAIDFDWRYGAQDFRITRLHIGLGARAGRRRGGAGVHVAGRDRKLQEFRQALHGGESLLSDARP